MNRSRTKDQLGSDKDPGSGGRGPSEGSLSKSASSQADQHRRYRFLATRFVISLDILAGCGIFTFGYDNGASLKLGRDPEPDPDAVTQTDDSSSSD